MDQPDSYTLKFKALSSSQCRFFVIFIIAATLIAAAIVVATLIQISIAHEITFKRRAVMSVAWVAGLAVFFFCALLPKLFAREYEVRFEKRQIWIKTLGQTTYLSYDGIQSCFISNKTDYSRIKFILNDGRKLVMYVGLCNMLNTSKQALLENLYSLNDFFVGFRAEANGKRGTNTITYTRNH